MSFRKNLAFALALLALLAGCDTVFDQAVVIRVVDPENQGVKDFSLRYYAAASCKGSYVAGSTSTVGEARFSRKAVRGGVGVLLEEPSICREQGGVWQAAWQQHIDPANQENFVCRLELDSQLKCERRSQGGA